MKKKHVFLSYCHDNEIEVASLHNDLIAVGENVWWDKDILPGKQWEQEISLAMKSAYAVILCLSQEVQNRHVSGIYPEAKSAIEAFRNMAPGSIFLIPVRLSECQIPALKIDGTTMLEGIQYIDMFPETKRSEGLARLLAALKEAPLRLQPQKYANVAALAPQINPGAINITNSNLDCAAIGNGNTNIIYRR